MALTLPMLLLVLMAIMELSLIALDALVLANAAREGARAAALGRSTTEIRQTVEATAEAKLPSAEALSITPQRRSQTAGVWGSWTTLGDAVDGGVTYNDAATSDQVRVSVAYQHPLITGFFLHPGDQARTMTLTALSTSLRFGG